MHRNSFARLALLTAVVVGVAVVAAWAAAAYANSGSSQAPAVAAPVHGGHGGQMMAGMMCGNAATMPCHRGDEARMVCGHHNGGNGCPNCPHHGGDKQQPKKKGK